MAIGVTPIPGYLNTNPQAGIEAFLRAQQLVQQRQAQIAQEKNERDRTAIAAQAQAAQAAIQQRSLGLKEQEHKSSIEVEANRLRLKQQQGEAEDRLMQQEQAAKLAELRSEPRAIQFPGMPGGVVHRGEFQFNPIDVMKSKPGALYKLGDRIPVGNKGDAVIVTGPNTGQYVSGQEKPTLERRSEIQEEGRRKRTDIDILTGDRRAVMNQLAKDDSEIIKMGPERRKVLEGRLEEINRELKEQNKKPEQPVKEKSPSQVINEERAKLANQLEKENPTWTPGQVYSEAIKQIP